MNNDKQLNKVMNEFYFIDWHRDSMDFIESECFSIQGRFRGLSITWISPGAKRTAPRMFVGEGILPRIKHKENGFTGARFNKKVEIKEWLETVWDTF